MEGHGHTERANGEVVKSLRKKFGITQKELARLSGYSERLILKLEAGEAVRVTTLEIIAETFCELGGKVSVTELTVNPISVAKEFVRIYKEREARFMEFGSHLIADDFYAEVAGDPEVIPFAGNYHGHEGLGQFFENFFGFVHRPYKDFFQPQFYCNGNEVAAFGQEVAVIYGQEDLEEKPSWIALRFVMKDGKIAEFYDYYDTQSATKYSEEFTGQPLQG